MARAFDIAIIGAGIAGLAAATLLRRAGHRLVVYERFAASRPIGSGLMLQPTGLAALERLGLRGPVEALGARIDLTTEAVARCIEEAGFGFMFAPAHHQATRFVVPVRRSSAICLSSLRRPRSQNFRQSSK